jgi:phosphoglycerol transferase MdoB-like AlkP superfamily enzyme
MLMAASSGLFLSLLMGALIGPAGKTLRRPSIYSLLSGLAWWLSLFALTCLVSQRLYFSITFVVVWHGVILAVNHAKYTTLKEPFILQDFEYFTDALRHPQLYIPFFGVIKTLLLITAGAVAIGVFFWLEASLSQVWTWWWVVPACVLVLAVATSVGAWAIRPQLSFDPVNDIQKTGLFSLMHSHLAEYWLARKRTLSDPTTEWPKFDLGKPLPHLVMVQSESFFDPRSCYPFVASSILKNWDEHVSEAAAKGRLNVPAWGANTVRTESAVLTGLSQKALGIHRYNPYRRFVKQSVSSLASHLQTQGYTTICVHPYSARFYQRDRVMPALGFDQFIDIKEFTKADVCGQYTGDLAVAEKVTALLAGAQGPLFIFVITMENHGPLHLEQPDPELEQHVYSEQPHSSLQDLTVYVRHLQNADQALAKITSAIEATARGGSLCWYGDHVPIMADVYRHFGEPDATTPWMIWSTAAQPEKGAKERVNEQPLAAEHLAEHWLQTVKERHRIEPISSGLNTIHA